ncbi:MAG: LAGLIDADG family homing endonuclease [Promethearchaeota archaeon]
MVDRTRKLGGVEQRFRIPLPTKELDFRGGRFYHKVKLPEEVTELLAENVGMHISDGHMGSYEGSSKKIQYHGHAIDDFPYYAFHFVPLLKQLWGTSRIYFRGVKGEQTLIVEIKSKQLVLFKHKVLGLPYGKKKTIMIPAYFLKNLRILRILMRGLFDGDGSLSFKSKGGLAHTYPVLSFSSISEPLMKQLQEQLGQLGFVVPKKLWEREDGTFYLAINGDKNYERWMNIIGFNNPKHLTKVVLYEVYGYVPPYTDLVERIKLIRGDLQLNECYSETLLRKNEHRLIEKKILEFLFRENSWSKELGRQLNLYPDRVRGALRRLEQCGLVKCILREQWGRYIYQLTPWGINKLRRVERILKRLRDEFNLAV